MNIESIKKDVLELEGILELYDWIQNYDKTRVPTKKNLFLLIKTKLNLNINKNFNLTPKSNNKKINVKNDENEFLSEKHERIRKINKYSNSELFKINSEKRIRPSTYCPIYPISTLSRIHNAFLEASYRNKNFVSSSIFSEDENDEIQPNINLEINPEILSNDKLSNQDNNSVLNFSETEYDEDKYQKYQNCIDIKSLNNLINYLENILKSKIKDTLEKKTENFGLSNNFCFLSLWKKIEEILNFQFGEINDEIIVWQQLRDVLLLTGMSLKYPTWSGEQLTNIITRIIPKKTLDIIKNQEFADNHLNYDQNRGLIELYNIFLDRSSIIFDLTTVSKLIQENLKYYLKFKKSFLENFENTEKDENTVEIKQDNNSKSNQICSNINSGFNTCREFDFDDEGYASMLEIESEEIEEKRESLERGVKLVDSLGLFADIHDVQRIVEIEHSYKNNHEEKLQSITLESNQIHFHEISEPEVIHYIENIDENILSLNISKKMIQEIIDHSDSNVKLEKEILQDVCKIIENCICNSNIILNHINKNKITKKNKKFYLFISVIFLIISFITIYKIGYIDFQLKSNYIQDINNYKDNIASRILFKKNQESIEVINNEHMMKTSDCIISKWEDLQGNNSNICNIIGDITVIERCFTNIYPKN